MKILLIFLLTNFNTLVSKSDTILIKKDVRIANEISTEERIIRKICELNRFLDGYLIFELLSNKNETDKDNYYAKVFYIDTLHYDSDTDNKIFYNVENQIIIQSGLFVGENDSIYKDFVLIWKCFRAFNKDKPKRCQPFLFDSWEGFKTNIFEENVLVEKHFKKYFIYRVKMNAIIYEFYTKEDTTLKKVFIPISELHYFSPVGLEQLEIFDYEKSSEVVRFH